MKYLKYLSPFVASVLVALSLAYAASGQKTIPLANGKSTSSVTNTFANSQVDTVRFTREAGLSGLAFAFYSAESLSVTNVICRRVVNGRAQSVIAGDTIVGAFAFAGATADTMKLATVTLAPIPTEYWFIVTYAGSANGVTAPTVKYYAECTYNK